MENNVSNYQEYTFPELLEQYDKVLVPMIQRDYAQGRKDDKKAIDVRKNLLNDIFTKKSVHFDLVFGSKESRIIDGKEIACFIPIDGQQRLTTLFLLYLYAQKTNDSNLDLSKFSYDTRRAASDFCKDVTTKEWSVQKGKKVSDVIKDSSWFMDYWDKDPTVEGMLNMLDAIHEKANGKKFPNLDKVKFYFFDLESHGLNENLYLKMNSRGKPLTAFENLKAKIEKMLSKDIQIDGKCFPQNDAAPKDSFKEKWKFFMDRDWTNAFWDKDNPSKYDVNITKFIVRFLSGYWSAFGQESGEKINEKTIAENLQGINKKEKDDQNYADYIPFEPIEKVLKLDNAFPSLAYAFTTAPTIEPYWSNDSIKVSDKSEYKLLSVIFTFTLFDGDKSAMRFAWNMAENYVSEYDNFVTYCKRVGEIYKFKHDNNVTFYKSLSDIKFDGNISDQLKEEIAKAKKILSDNEWESKIIEAEKTAFFKGAIRFLFQDAEGSVTEDSWKDFDTKWENAQKYFDVDGVKNSDGDRSIFRKLLLCISEFKLLYEFYYDDSIKNWRQHILLNSNLAKCVNDLLLDSTPADRRIRSDSQQAVFSDLTESNLLSGIPEGFELDQQGNKYLLTKKGKGNGQDNKKYFIGIIRNRLLYNLFGGNIAVEQNNVEQNKEQIFTDQKNTTCDFFWGWNINFKYHNHFFQWYGNPQDNNPNNGGRKELDVYLMMENWEDYWPRNNETADKFTENGNYFCFKVTNLMMPKDFLSQLDCLIAQQQADERGKPCDEDCNITNCDKNPANQQ